MPKLSSRDAYRLWSQTYDLETDNVLVAVEGRLFARLFSEANLTDKVVVDIGCGTGRHWDSLLARRPRGLHGVDNSPEMLARLRARYPDAMLHLRAGSTLDPLGTGDIDIITSRLMIGYVPRVIEEFREWTRVLRVGGEIIFTDFHPDALVAGAKRTMTHAGRTFEIENYIHPVSALRAVFDALHLQILRLDEEAVDESVRPIYERHQALDVYFESLGKPLVLGMRLRKVL